MQLTSREDQALTIIVYLCHLSLILFSIMKNLVNKYLDGKLPETMDELIAMAKKVKADSGGEVAGAAMRGLRTDTNIDTISGLVFNAGGIDLLKHLMVYGLMEIGVSPDLMILLFKKV